MPSNHPRRMSLLDDLEHVAELAELAELLGDDDEDSENDNQQPLGSGSQHHHHQEGDEDVANEGLEEEYAALTKTLLPNERPIPLERPDPDEEDEDEEIVLGYVTEEDDEEDDDDDDVEGPLSYEGVIYEDEMMAAAEGISFEDEEDQSRFTAGERGDSSSLYGSGEYGDESSLSTPPQQQRKASSSLADQLATIDQKSTPHLPGGQEQQQQEQQSSDQFRESLRSFQSAPEPTTTATTIPGTADQNKMNIAGAVYNPRERRSTITGPPAATLSRRFSSARRSNINVQPTTFSGHNSLGVIGMSNDDFAEIQGGSMLQKMKSRTPFGARRSGSRHSTVGLLRNSRSSTLSSITGGSSGGSNNTSTFDALQVAAAKIESGQFDASTEASVVAQSAASAAKRGHVQFGTDDVVLCLLSLLNVFNEGDDPDTFTVNPVNEHGYPVGEGKTDVERQEPHVFVLATVSQVHFDENERYYTVIRADNGSEQRAHPGGFCLFLWLGTIHKKSIYVTLRDRLIAFSILLSHSPCFLHYT